MTEHRFRLGILALDGCMLSSIASASDSLRIAQKLAEIRHPGGPLRMESVVFGARGIPEMLFHARASGLPRATHRRAAKVATHATQPFTHTSLLRRRFVDRIG